MCGLGEEAVEFVRLVIERNDATTNNKQRIGVNAVWRALVSKWGYRATIQPIREHAIYCLGRRTWGQP